MHLISYKMTDDTGFAPNPFHRVCTLATCKSWLRTIRHEGHWIAGFTSATLNGDAVGSERLVYLMLVDESLDFDDYFRDPRFAAKIPRAEAPRCVDRAGDNIYFRREGVVQQVSNRYHGPGELADDTRQGARVLISREFYYFGREPLAVPPQLRPRVPRAVAPYGWPTTDGSRSSAFLDFVRTGHQSAVVYAAPTSWPPGDDSWAQA